MIKIITATFTALAVTLSLCVVFYWRDIAYDPTGTEFIYYFLLLPLLLTFLLLSPYFIFKGIQQYKKNQQEKQKIAQEAEHLQAEKEGEQQKPAPLNRREFALNIYSAAAWHSFGENEAILEQIRQFKSPELDTSLCNAYGLPILSFRIQALDELVQSEDDEMDYAVHTTMRKKRIVQLLAYQIEKHADTLFMVSSHLKRSARYYDSELAYQYRMHPAWTDPHLSSGEIGSNSDRTAEKVAKLNCLNIHIFLPENLMHHWHESARKKMLEEFTETYAIAPAQMNIEYHFIHQGLVYSAWLKVLEGIAEQADEFNLLINADSEIDQEWLDEKIWQTERYIASEFSSSWCIAGTQTEICDLSPQKTLKMTLDEQQAKQFLHHSQLNALTQFDQDHPFILMLDDPAEIQTAKKLQRQFADTAIETHHFLYTQQNFGHTQQVAKIFAFMLGMHFPDDLIAMIYSTDQDSAYAYFTDYKDERFHTELR